MRKVALPFSQGTLVRKAEPNRLHVLYPIKMVRTTFKMEIVGECGKQQDFTTAEAK
jgi:hypothetical protein